VADPEAGVEEGRSGKLRPLEKKKRAGDFISGAFLFLRGLPFRRIGQQRRKREQKYVATAATGLQQKAV
jgi:hypothetical protein